MAYAGNDKPYGVSAVDWRPSVRYGCPPGGGRCGGGGYNVRPQRAQFYGARAPAAESGAAEVAPSGGGSDSMLILVVVLFAIALAIAIAAAISIPAVLLAPSSNATSSDANATSTNSTS